MSKFNKTSIINVFSELGSQLIDPNTDLSAIINDEKQYNAWFTPESVLKAIQSIGKMLNRDDLTEWLERYELIENKPAKRIGLILAGNIPMVGFHDVLCVLVSGNNALIKSSSQDARLIKYVLQLLVNIDNSYETKFSFVERLENFDAVIATGSNNTSRYFEYYFGKVPYIIRKNRSSVAVLNGDETAGQLFEFGRDIFDYYGLGCRNVSKVFVPKGYRFDFFFESIESYQPIINHHKYNNNYDYNKSIYLVNREMHFDNGFLLLKEDEKLASPLAVLFYEYYNELETVQEQLKGQSENIQCIVTDSSLKANNQVVDFGKSQQPALWDYADNADTMAFLISL